MSVMHLSDALVLINTAVLLLLDEGTISAGNFDTLYCHQADLMAHGLHELELHKLAFTETTEATDPGTGIATPVNDLELVGLIKHYERCLSWK